MALPIATDDQTTSSETVPGLDLMSRQNQALQQLVQSLNTRQNPNYFSIAGQLFDPGKTGSAGEALGRASAEMGRQQEQKEQQAPSIAMLKAQLLNQEYQLGLKQQGMKMLSNIMGGGISPEDAAKQVLSGNISPSVARIANPRQVIGLMAVDKDYGNALKAGIELQQKDFENAIKLFDSGVEITKATANLSPVQKQDFMQHMDQWRAVTGLPGPKTPTSSTTQRPTEPSQNATEPSRNVSDITSMLGNGLTLSSGYGTRQDPFNRGQTEQHTHLDLTGKAGTEIKSVGNGTVVKAGVNGGFGNYVEVKDDKGMSTFYGHLKDINPNIKEGDIVSQGQIIGSLGSTGRSTGTHLAFGMKDAKGNPINPMERIEAARPVTQKAEEIKGAGLVQRFDETPADFAKRRESVEAPQIKDFGELASGLNKINIDSLKTSISDLGELKKIADYQRKDGTNPIFATLQKRDIDNYVTAANKAVMQILQEGGSMTLNGVHARVGINLEPVYKNLVFSEKEKNMSERAANIISTQIIQNIIANKTAAFGGSRVTNYQDQQLSALNANMNQLPQYIKGWATRRMIDNASMLELGDAFNSYMRKGTQGNQVADPAPFFRSKLYREELPNRHTEEMNKALKIYPYY